MTPEREAETRSEIDARGNWYIDRCLAAIATLRTERDAAREDTRLAAGELLVDMDEAPPGSLVARLLTACRLMMVERDKALEQADCGRTGHSYMFTNGHEDECPHCGIEKKP